MNGDGRESGSGDINDEMKALAAQWLAADWKEESQKEVRAMLENGDVEELNACLGKRIKFSTAGLRGVMRTSLPGVTAGVRRG